jgi:Mn2+/Fe2+ NRAMP family transporter
MVSVEEAAQQMNIKAVIGTAIVSAFGFIIALFWRDAITAVITDLVPEGEGLLYSFFVAILVTIIAVVAIYMVSRWMNTSMKDHVKKLRPKA